MRLKRLQQRGDTMIEVLIAIAIASLVLTAAYVITNQNSQSIQANQERIQAQHLVESQIEALRANGKLDNSGDCFIGTTETKPTDPGSPCDTIGAAGSGATYHVSVALDDTTQVYTITATWDSLGGTSDNDSNVTMYYRLD